MEQVEGQVHLTVKEVTPLLDQVTSSIADDLLSASMKLNEYSTQLLLPTQTYATIGSGIVIWDANNHLIDANEAAQRILGMNFYELQQHLATHPGGVFLRTDGSPLSIEKQCSTIAWQTGIAQYNRKDMEGGVIGVVASFMDVTTHIEAVQHAQQEDRFSGECERLEAALYISEKRFHMVVASVPVILNTFDRSGIITLSIGGGLESLGLVPGESVGHAVFELYSAYPAMLNNVRRALAGEAFASVHHVKERVFNTRFTPILNQHNKVDSLVSIAVDITEREKAEESLHQNGQIYQALSEQATDLVFITSAEGMYKYLSPSHQRIMGYDSETLLNKNVFSYIHPEDRKQVQAAFSLTLRNPEILAKTICRCTHANGTWVILECTGRNCLQDPAVKGFIVNARDITDQVKLEETLRHQALHDALTDLPNRTFLQKRLNQALINAERQQNGVALLSMDLDRFKEINETFGHQHGDLLLQQVSARLVQAIGSAGTVSRLGGDEFAILLPKADEESTGIIAEQLRNVLEEPFIIAGYPLNVEASVGIVLYPLHGTDGLTLMRRADVAMYTAKSTHEGVAFYKATHDDQYSSHRLTLIGALRQAITANELMLYYQPKVDLKTGLISSVEALARWQHPMHGFVPPDQFIPLAEQTGLINALTAWALETAVRQCSVWLQAGLSISVAVNLSSWNLRDITLPEPIMSLLTRYSVPPQLLRVELTESAIMTDTDRALDVLHRLSALGIHISVDDFGTGYSSLAYLKRLPIDELKIDRSFVQHMLEVEADVTIVRSTIMLAHNLGLNIVAEGIEGKATLNLLADFDCDIAQGYYMSRPIPAAELECWLHSSSQLVTR